MNINKLSGISEYPLRADQSAVAPINRALRVTAPILDTPGISLMFIIGAGGDKIAPYISPGRIETHTGSSVDGEDSLLTWIRVVSTH